LYASALIRTSDEFLIIGEMGDRTFSPGKLQFVGGGLDRDCIKGNELDIRKCIINEIHEELGLPSDGRNIMGDVTPRYLITGGKHGFLSVVFKTKLKISRKAFKDLYERYSDVLVKKGSSPEFAKIHFASSIMKCNTRGSPGECAILSDYE